MIFKSISSLFFLLPCGVYRLPLILVSSLICLTLCSCLYHYDRTNSIFIVLDSSSIIMVCSLYIWYNIYYTLLLLLLFCIEYFSYKSFYIKYLIYGYAATRNIYHSPLAMIPFLISIFVYMSNINSEFSYTNRFLWHFGQSLYICWSTQQFLKRIEKKIMAKIK